MSRQHGPPTHFITLTCAENWWQDLREIYLSLECNEGQEEQCHLLDAGDFKAMCKAAQKCPLYVNEYFMMRAEHFLDNFAREALELEYYWGRVEFAPGRGAIHLHILGIARNKAYLNDFYNAKNEKTKIEVLQKYVEEYLGMTANIKLDDHHIRFHADGQQKTTTDMTPLGTRYSECSNPDLDHVHLVQGAMLHSCSEYCLGEKDKEGKKLSSVMVPKKLQIKATHLAKNVAPKL